jgi:hypothetical protein
MSAPRDPDLIVADWLDEGPTRLPDQTRRAIAVDLRSTSQRRPQIWMPQRRPLMNPIARFAIAAVVIVVVIGGALYVFTPGQDRVGGPPAATASPSPRPSAPPSTSASPSSSPVALANQGFVYPGTYIPKFDPPLTFRIDREVEHNCAPGFTCRGSIDANLPAWIDLEFGQPRIEVHIFRVDKLDDPAEAGRLIDPPVDLAAWIASRPDLTVVAQQAVTVGGLAGTQLDVRTGSKGVEFGPITGVTDPGMGLGADDTARLIVVPVAGRQVLIMLRAEDGSIEEIQPLADSIVWR